MNILIVSGGFPSLKNAKEAAEIVQFSISQKLVSEKHTVDLQIINFKNYYKIECEIPGDTKKLYRNILKPILINYPTKFERLTELFPLKKFEMKKYFDDIYEFSQYDLILPIWTEIGTKIVSTLPNKKISYHGNLDFLVRKSNFVLDFQVHRNIISFLRLAIYYLIYPFEKRNLLFYLSKYKHIFNVSKLDSDHLKRLGIESSYIQMTWSSKDSQKPDNKQKPLRKDEEYRVCCSVGKLSNTGNSFAFITLLKEIIPALKKRDLTKQFKLQIYGGGDFKYKFLRKALIDNGIEIMGFVDNLEAELKDSAFSIIPHNKFSHKVSHTRVLHNWSIGLPIILFEDSALAMPELMHNFNCLLAKDAKEFVNYMAQLIDDNDTRLKLIQNGKETLKEKFSVQNVTNEIIKKYGSLFN